MMQGINVLLTSNENTQGGVMAESNSADHGISTATRKKGLIRQSISDVTSTTAEEEAQEAAAAIDKMMAASVTATADAFVSRVYSANIFSDLYVIPESARQHDNQNSSPRLRKSRHLTYEDDDRRLNGLRNDTWEGTQATYPRKRPLSPTMREFILRRPQPTLDDEQQTSTVQNSPAHQEETTRPTSISARQEQQTRHMPTRRQSLQEVKMMDVSERRPPTKSTMHKVSSRAA